MTTVVYLVRHAAHALCDRVLVGRTPGVALSRTGLQQAQGLAERLQRKRISCVQSSPQLRARQTAQPIAAALELSVETVPEVDELDAGGWSGLSFDQLAGDTRWSRWNCVRGSARIPGGESMREIQNRVLAHLAGLEAEYPGRRVVIVSHAEPIRAILLHYRGIPLDDFARVRVDPASLTTLLLRRRGGEVVAENEPADRLVTA